MLITPVTPEFVQGAVDLEVTERGLMPHRLTPAARRHVNGPVDPTVFSDPSGVRLRLRTAAEELTLVTWPQKRITDGQPDGPPPVYDVWRSSSPDGEADTLHAQLTAEGGTWVVLDPVTGSEISRKETRPAQLRISGLPARPTLLEIWLPYQEWTTLVEFRSPAPVEPAGPRPGALRWVHHGSSISHGAVTVGASHAWPAVAARTLSAASSPVHLTNLGFAGNAKLDPFTARTLREIPADVITLKLGINVVNGDSHTLRSFTPAVHGFLDTIREGRHAETPLVVISPIWCGIHEDTPGPVEAYTARDSHGGTIFRALGDPADTARGRITLRILRQELERIIALRREEDPHLHFLSGLELYGESDAATHPFPDHLHPDTAGHRLIGERFADWALRAGFPPAAAM